MEVLNSMDKKLRSFEFREFKGHKYYPFNDDTAALENERNSMVIENGGQNGTSDQVRKLSLEKTTSNNSEKSVQNGNLDNNNNSLDIQADSPSTFTNVNLTHNKKQAAKQTSSFGSNVSRWK